jgi:putative phage-type endonuclease
MTVEQWHVWRRAGIGGSDAPAIMGVSPYSTPFQKWEEKVFDKSKKDNWAMRGGRLHEEEARCEYESMTGIAMFPRNVESTEINWLHASLDGIDNKGKRIVEIKRAGEEDHEMALKGIVPPKYIPQCQHIFKTTNGDCDVDYFSSPVAGGPGVIVKVDRDSSYIESELFPKEVEFWNLVLSQKAPEFTDRDFKNMEKNKLWKKASADWLETKDILEVIKQKESDLRKDLILLAKDRSAEGFGVKLSKTMTRGNVDYMAAFAHYIACLQEKYPEIEFGDLSLEMFRKDPFVKWTLRDIS